MEELKGNYILEEAVTAGAYVGGATAIAPSVIDCANFENVKFYLDVGTLNSTQVVASVTQCATSDGTYTAISGKTITITEAGQGYVEVKPYDRTQRYMKLSFTQTTDATDTFSAVALKQAKVKPQTDT